MCKAWLPAGGVSSYPEHRCLPALPRGHRVEWLPVGSFLPPSLVRICSPDCMARLHALLSGFVIPFAGFGIVVLHTPAACLHDPQRLFLGRIKQRCDNGRGVPDKAVGRTASCSVLCGARHPPCLASASQPKPHQLAKGVWNVYPPQRYADVLFLGMQR